MNKLIAPLILILAFSMASCSKDSQKILNSNIPNTTQLEPTDSNSDKVILNAKVGNFCEGHECPDGIIAVKTNDKSVTCAGIVESATEVLISQNCAEASNTFHIQTTAGEIIKVTSVEEVLSNEFNDKVLKLTTSKELETLATISIPDPDNNSVELLSFDKFGVLTKQSCELTYASLAYANSFDNESQLLNIKNCDGVKDGALISQDGNVIGFLTKKHEEIALYEGVSLNGTITTESITSKIDSLSLNYDNNDALVLGLYASVIPLMEGEYSNQEIIFNEKNFTFEVNTLCLNKELEEAYEDEKIKIVFNNDIYEFNERSKIKVLKNIAYIPMKYSLVADFNQSLGEFNKSHKHIIYSGSINELAQANNYSNINKTENIFYIITPVNDDRYKTKNIDFCK
ncbi:putative lipoprotein [Bacteriovorax sp. BAL6_X]|uniref:hypothetical protein n=1 Tax=Bacteriovorax sp. BAL6_X TaxID=1201290 RepID=UPI0003862158|nr:hypothetical protein [Bacteriovorax sp. BAL6_X]EPZ50526.1 putative lipoprotein [Bacteriovorax sp. BAL6_X]